DTVPGLKEQGGLAHLAKLAAQSVVYEDPASLARDVLDAHQRRQLIAIASDTTAAAYSPQAEDTAAVQIETAERRLYELSKGDVRGGFSTFGKSLGGAIVQAEAAHQRRGQLSGVTTGLAHLDHLLGGLHRS